MSIENPACPRCVLTCFLSLPPRTTPLAYNRGPGILCLLPSVFYLQFSVFSLPSSVFMQNKPNFDKGQNKPNPLYKKDLRKFYTPSVSGKTNPIKPNFQKAQMNVTSFITKDYRKNDAFAVQKNKPNSNPISSKAKMNANAFSQKDYENETAFRPQKNKPNSNPISKQLVGARPRRPESAKMAQKIDVLKHQNIILEKSNFLYPNRLNSLNQHNPPTGTLFAHSSPWNFLYTGPAPKRREPKLFWCGTIKRKEFNYG